MPKISPKKLRHLQARAAAFDEALAMTENNETVVNDNRFSITHQSLLGKVYAGALASMFLRNPDAKNVIEVQLSSSEVGPITVTIQRTEGKTPMDLRREALERVAELEAELAAIKNQQK